MSEVKKCPMCQGPVEVEVGEDGAAITYRHTLSVLEIGLALQHGATVRAVATIIPAELKLAVAAVLLEPIRDGESPYFSEKDVEDESEARARCIGVVKELRKRDKWTESAEFVAMAERHGTRALRILGLLAPDVQQQLKQRIYAPEFGGSLIEVAKH